MSTLTNKTGIMVLATFLTVFSGAWPSFAGRPSDLPTDEGSISAVQQALAADPGLQACLQMAYPLKTISYGETMEFKHPAWQDFLAGYGGRWRVTWDPRAGRPNIIEGQGIPFYAGRGNALTRERDGLTLGSLHEKLLEFIGKNNALLRLDRQALRLNEGASAIFENGRYALLQYDYLMGDVPVEGARAIFRFNNGNLVQFGSMGIGDATIPVSPAWSALEAEAQVIRGFGAEGDEVLLLAPAILKVVPEITPCESVHEPYQGQEGAGLGYRLIWEIVFEQADPMASWKTWVDALDGTILSTQNLTRQAFVTGWISRRPGLRIHKPVPFCSAQNNGTKNCSYFSHYLYTDSPSTHAGVGLDALFMNVQDQCGTGTIEWATDTSPGNIDSGSSTAVDCGTPGTGGEGNTWSARSTFWHATMIRTKADWFLHGVAGINTWLDGTVNVVTNLANDCNAYYNGLTNTMRFYQTYGNCNNSGEIETLIHHEWGHGLDAYDGGPPLVPVSEQASGEAYGDFLAAMMTKEPCWGQGWYTTHHCTYCPPGCFGDRFLALRFDDDGDPGTPGVPVRPSNITNNNGPNCDQWTCVYATYRGIMGYEGHCESYISSGALWDTAQNLVAAEGEAGWVWMDRLWFESVPSLGSAFQITSGGTCNTSAATDGCAAANWYTVLLGADDDNGDLADGTPHGGRIWDAFNAHGIACGLRPADSSVCTPPAAPVLSFVASNNQVALAWTPVAGATDYVVYMNEYSAGADCDEAGWIPHARPGAVNGLTLLLMPNDYGHGFAVQAVNGAMDCVSAMSNCVWAAPIDSAPVNLYGKKPAGWDSPFVLTDNSCTSTDCLGTLTLSGDGGSYADYVVSNNTSLDAGVAHVHRITRDGELLQADPRPLHAANTDLTRINQPLTIKGGRHVLKFMIDADANLTEATEDDNTFMTSAIYQPFDLDLDPDHLAFRTAPPDRNPEGYAYYSCDGYQFSFDYDAGFLWAAAAILPDPSSNYDLRLYNDYEDAANGFADYVNTSTVGSFGQPEIVGVNGNLIGAGGQVWWAGAIQSGDLPQSGNYGVHADRSQGTHTVPGGPGVGSIPAGGIVAMEEVLVDAGDLGQTWQISVVPTGGDIALALIAPTMVYFNLGAAIPGTLINESGEDVPEMLNLEFPAAGKYGLLIYKPDHTQLANAIDFTLEIGPPPNLRPYTRAGWTAPAVPRNAGGCEFNACPITDTLPGWTGTTYLSETTVNDGPMNINRAFAIRFTLDDASLEDMMFSSLAGGITAFGMNHAFANIKGGRHTLGVIADSLGGIPEANETDNTYYAQYVWSPKVLESNTPFTTPAPPDRNSTNYSYYNCDGYQFAVPATGGVGYWGIVGILPLTDTSNFDVRLHDDYAGSTAGFASNLGYSSLGGAGAVEIIGVNRNLAAATDWWAGVVQGGDEPGAGNYAISKDASGASLAVPSTGSAGTLVANEVAAVEEIYVDSTDLGKPWRFRVTPVGGDIGIALLDQGLPVFMLADAMPDTRVDGAGVNGAETFTVTFPAEGYYGLLIYKANSTQAALSIAYMIDIISPANLRPFTKAGWSAPVVPRNAAGCTSVSCALTPTLPGWSGTTYVNQTTNNDGPANIGDPFVIRYTLDGGNLEDLSYGALGAGSYAMDTNNAVGVVKGGRHTLAVIADAGDACAESDETDNTHAAQYVWSPYAISNGENAVITPPPDWDSPGYTWPNCDGFQTTFPNTWNLFTLVPQTATDTYHLRLHNDYANSTAGFEAPLLQPWPGPGETALILINSAVAGGGPWQFGVIQGSTTPYAGNYTVSNKGNAVGFMPPGIFGPYTLPSARIGDVYSVSIAQAATWKFRLDITSGTADLAMAVYPSTGPGYYQTTDFVSGAWANSGRAGADEAFTVALNPGTYAVVVYKATTAAHNAGSDTNFNLWITAGGIGETPDNDLIPGDPLTVAKQGPDDLLLGWGSDCAASPVITRYFIYRGTLASLGGGVYDHAPLSCTAIAGVSLPVARDTGDYYYLVVPTDTIEEGGYGFNSQDLPRPASGAACLPQNRMSCP